MNLDLTTAIEAAARAEYEAAWESLGGASWDDAPDEDNRAEWRRTTAAAVAAAAPLIAAQVGEQIAAAIEAEGRQDIAWLAKYQDDRIDAARIVGAEDAWRNAIRVAREAVR